MKTFIQSAILVMMLASCGNPTKSGDTTSESTSEQPTSNQTSAVSTDNVKNGRSAYTFKTSFQKDGNGQCNALVLTCTSGEKSQDFTFEFNWSKDEDFLKEEGSGDIDEMDLNNDGFADVTVCLGNFGVTGPMYFHGACLWNDASQCFEVVENYSDIANPQPGSGEDKKSVFSQYEGLDGSVTTDYYEWKDGQLVLVKSDTDEADD